MIYGYARVATDGQSVDGQVRQLTKAGCKKVFREVASGAKTDRAQLRLMLDQLAAGDVVMVTRLDRLPERVAYSSCKETLCEAFRWGLWLLLS
jgi:DNA invertase Pin-like site-specific DNA recombinase